MEKWLQCVKNYRQDHPKVPYIKALQETSKNNYCKLNKKCYRNEISKNKLCKKPLKIKKVIRTGSIQGTIDTDEYKKLNKKYIELQLDFLDLKNKYYNLVQYQVDENKQIFNELNEAHSKMQRDYDRLEDENQSLKDRLMEENLVSKEESHEKCYFDHYGFIENLYKYHYKEINDILERYDNIYDVLPELLPIIIKNFKRFYPDYDECIILDDYKEDIVELIVDIFSEFEHTVPKATIEQVFS